MKRRETTIAIVAGLILLILGLTACGPAQDVEDEAATATARAENMQLEEPEVASNDDEGTDTSDNGDFDIYAGLGEEGFTTTESGLKYAILEPGGSEMPQAGQVVSVHYTGWLEDGTEFDSSISRGEPITFPFDQGGLIEGWLEAMRLLHQGDKVRLIIPSDLAYGDTGSPPTIPGGATLVFDLELVEISEGAPEAPTEVAADDYQETASGLKYYDMVVGDGASPEPGKVVTMHFTLWLEDGTMLGSSLNTGQPVQVQVGSGQLFEGWEEGLLGMQVGGSRQLVIPPELAFGETGTPDGVIPPNATITLEMELLDVFDASQ